MLKISVRKQSWIVLKIGTHLISDEECNSSRAQSPIVTAVLKNPSVVSSWPKHLKSPWNSSQLS